MTSIVYVVASAAPPVLRLAEGVAALKRKGWVPCLILTPTAASWVDLDEIERITSYPVRVHPRLPHDRDPLPKASAILAAPVTFNTLNKWATGASDTLALGLLNEAIGLDVRITAAPVIKAALRKHPAYALSITTLRNAGVDIIDPDEATIRLDDGTVTVDWNSVADRVGRP